jgi:hypothetical protein
MGLGIERNAYITKFVVASIIFPAQIFKTSDLRMRERASARSIPKTPGIPAHPRLILSYFFTGSLANPRLANFGLAADTD